MQRDGNKDTDSLSLSHSQKNAVFTTLVVEEDLAYADFLAKFLKTEGHYILRASTAEGALAMVRQHWPDLILLNREMSGTNGLKFLPELLMEHPSAAIIMMASHSNSADAVEAIKLGAVDYLERPLDADKLRNAIATQRALYEIL
ncbi:MAG TPA: response regulator [bacterium]|nr:response regulator [bacterium]